jgi:hypothetical protein
MFMFERDREKIKTLECLFEGAKIEIDGLKNMQQEVFRQIGDLGKAIRSLCPHPEDKIKYVEKHLPYGEQQAGGGSRKIEWIFECQVCGSWLDSDKYKYVPERIERV